MSALELVRAIRELHPGLSVNTSVQTHPDPADGVFCGVTVLGLPADRFPEVRVGTYEGPFMLSLHGPDRRDTSATLSVVRYHDDDFEAALRTALEFLTREEPER